MKRIDLELEHLYKSKFVGRHRLRAGRRTWVLGRSKDADIRLMGDDVSDIHAYIECQGDTWTVTDAGSRDGTWMDKNPVTAETIKGVVTVTIGGHSLKFTPHAIEKEFFKTEDLSKETGTGTKMYHQAVVMKADRIVDTHLLDSAAPFKWSWGAKTEVLAAPKAGEMKETAFGEFKLIQRLVKSDVMKSHGGEWRGFIRDPEMRAPMATALVFLLLLIGLIVAIPKRPDQAMNEIKPDNKYTRMVFDADLMRKKRDQAKEARKSLMAKSPVSKAQPNPTPPAPAAQATNKVVKNLKLDSLNALLGKIAKRANSNGPMIAAAGRNPDSIDAGHTTTVAAVGSLQGIATQVGTAAGTFKIGSVGTSGVGGGHGVTGASGLATGGVGTGTVGILDEETEIEGGLDREVIAKVINGYLGEIRYCYERQLSAEPDIYGKVQVKFTIDGAGTVEEQHVGTTTLKSAMVEGCILRRLARWKFPKPKGGTHVLVTYPFMFKSTN